MNKLNNKKASPWISMAAIVILIIIIIFRLSINRTNEQEYQFPLSSEDIENVLTEQGIDMYVEDSSTIDESTHGTSLKDTIRNDTTLKYYDDLMFDNLMFGITSQVRNNHRNLNLIWHFPKTLSSEQVNDFFHNELSKQFELAGIFYGNKKQLDKELNKVLDYYLQGENYNNGSYWNNRVGNAHLIVRRGIGTLSTISMMIIPDELYEDYLSTTNELWKSNAEAQSIKIYEGTVAEMENLAREEVPNENNLDTIKHFVVKGHIKNIKENKVAPDQLANIDSNYLMPNRDKYLSAKLVDDTGSVDVFLQMTSLNDNQLSMERNHNVVIYYNKNEPVYVVRLSTLDLDN